MTRQHLGIFLVVTGTLLSAYPGQIPRALRDAIQGNLESLVYVLIPSLVSVSLVVFGVMMLPRNKKARILQWTCLGIMVLQLIGLVAMASWYNSASGDDRFRALLTIITYALIAVISLIASIRVRSRVSAD